MRTQHLFFFGLTALTACRATPKTDSDGSSGGAEADSDADTDTDADADADADADTDTGDDDTGDGDTGDGDTGDDDTGNGDTGDAPPSDPLEDVTVVLSEPSLYLNCQDPISPDPMLGYYKASITNDTTDDLNLRFETTLDIERNATTTESYSINTNPSERDVEGRTSANLTLQKSGTFSAKNPCDELCTRPMTISLTATAPDGKIASGTYSTTVECVY